MKAPAGKLPTFLQFMVHESLGEAQFYDPFCSLWGICAQASCTYFPINIRSISSNLHWFYTYQVYHIPLASLQNVFINKDWYSYMELVTACIISRFLLMPVVWYKRLSTCLFILSLGSSYISSLMQPIISGILVLVLASLQQASWSWEWYKVNARDLLWSSPLIANVPIRLH